MKKTATTDPNLLRERLRLLKLWGILAHFQEFATTHWLPRVLEVEEVERQRRSLQRRLHAARIGTFKPLADFNWAWPKRIDRELIDDLFQLKFIEEGVNVILLGPNGVGKTMVAQNLTHQAVVSGHTARFVTASDMLTDLATPDSDLSFRRRLRRYCAPQLLVVDEVGYLSYDSRYADLLFEVVTRRYSEQRAIILTTNKPFAEWAEVFPNAACVVTLVDRLVHRSELLQIDGESYRLREAKDRASQRKRSRPQRKGAAKPHTEAKPTTRSKR